MGDRTGDTATHRRRKRQHASRSSVPAAGGLIRLRRAALAVDGVSMCRSASGNTHLPLEDGLFEARAHHAQRPRALAAAPRCFAVRRLHAAALLAGDGLRRRAGGGRCGGRGRGGGLRVEAGEWAGGGGAPRERGAEAGQHCGGGGGGGSAVVRRAVVWVWRESG